MLQPLPTNPIPRTWGLGQPRKISVWPHLTRQGDWIFRRGLCNEDGRVFANLWHRIESKMGMHVYMYVVMYFCIYVCMHARIPYSDSAWHFHSRQPCSFSVLLPAAPPHITSNFSNFFLLPHRQSRGYPPLTLHSSASVFLQLGLFAQQFTFPTPPVQSHSRTRRSFVSKSRIVVCLLIRELLCPDTQTTARSTKARLTLCPAPD